MVQTSRRNDKGGGVYYHEVKMYFPGNKLSVEFHNVKGTLKESRGIDLYWIVVRKEGDIISKHIVRGI